MLNRPTTVALRNYLTDILRSHPWLIGEQGPFRERVYAVVDDLKAAGFTAEQAIVGVKRASADAGLRSSHYLNGPDVLSPHDAAIGSVVKWCIEHYYSNDAATVE